jgi:hypothetical protein
LARPRLFVHARHCTRCQRETGGAFAHHLLIETAQLHLLQGRPNYAQVPTDSGRCHWVASCAECHMVLWNAHGSRTSPIIYLRAGTLDAPAAWPPQAHIYVRSKPAWMVLDPAVPQFRGGYDARRIWPAESLERYGRAKTDCAAGPAPAVSDSEARRSPPRRAGRI